MTLQQTVTIPADRRLYLDLPRDTPLGEADVKLIITLHRVDRPVEAPLRPKTFDPVKARAAHERMCGMCKTDG
ncbi:MAG: hypothetical protein LBS64_06495, partial [Spirochaetaceae bacterium]|nr:hypothetical protein [Spirochaetaceae bacterium]